MVGFTIVAGLIAIVAVAGETGLVEMPATTAIPSATASLPRPLIGIPPMKLAACDRYARIRYSRTTMNERHNRSLTGAN
jgi:hypothetical protein